MKKRRALRLTALPAAALSVAALGGLSLLAGCGGASSAGAPAPARTDDPNAPNGNTRAAGLIGRCGVFVTATPGGKWDQVWATILKVELIDVEEKAVTVFDEHDGATLDLRRLAGTDTKNLDGRRAALLAAANVPAGKSYARVRVTLSKAVELFDPGAPTSKTTPLADSVGHDDQQRPVLSFTLDRPRDLGGGKEDLVIDFDLAKTVVKDERIVPSLHEGGKDAVARYANQDPGTFTGTVAEVTGPEGERVFTLSLGGNRAVSVAAGDATVFYNDDASPNPTLAEGKRVTVRGLWSAEQKRVVAGEVAVISGSNAGPAARVATPSPTLAKDGGDKDAVKLASDAATPSPKPSPAALKEGSGEAATPAVTGGGASSVVRGTLASINAKGGTLAVTATQVEGITPTQRAITVVVPPNAVLRSRGGLLLTADEFYQAAGAANTLARVEGNYEPVSGTLTATRIKIEDPTRGPAHEAEVKGTPRQADAKAGTLVVDNWTRWQGIAGRGEGKGITVGTTAATAFRDEKGEFLASANFFAAVAAGDKAVRVVGVYSDGTLTATRMELAPAEAKPAPDPKPADKDAVADADDERPEEMQNTRPLIGLFEDPETEITPREPAAEPEEKKAPETPSKPAEPKPEK